MPWDKKTIVKHNHALAGRHAAATRAAAQANAILAKTGDEGLSLAVANKNAKRGLVARAMG